MHHAKVVSATVACPAAAVYAFAREPENLPRWASGLAAGLSRENGDWFADSPMGKVKLFMAPPNDWGILDHEVTLPDGTVVLNAFRVTPAGDGACVLSFVVLASPGMGQADLDKDAAHVAHDLHALKRLMENRAG